MTACQQVCPSASKRGDKPLIAGMTRLQQKPRARPSPSEWSASGCRFGSVDKLLGLGVSAFRSLGCITLASEQASTCLSKVPNICLCISIKLIQLTVPKPSDITLHAHENGVPALP